MFPPPSEMKGEIVEQGKHAELLEMGGVYAALVSKQAMAPDAVSGRFTEAVWHTCVLHVTGYLDSVQAPPRLVRLCLLMRKCVGVHVFVCLWVPGGWMGVH